MSSGVSHWDCVSECIQLRFYFVIFPFQATGSWDGEALYKDPLQAELAKLDRNRNERKELENERSEKEEARAEKEVIRETREHNIRMLEYVCTFF